MFGCIYVISFLIGLSINEKNTAINLLQFGIKYVNVINIVTIYITHTVFKEIKQDL